MFEVITVKGIRVLVTGLDLNLVHVITIK